MVKEREGSLLHGTSIPEIEKVAFQPIFPEQTFVLGLNRRNIWGQEESYV
jgi:hypothetical protein